MREPLFDRLCAVLLTCLALGLLLGPTGYLVLSVFHRELGWFG